MKMLKTLADFNPPKPKGPRRLKLFRISATTSKFHVKVKCSLRNTDKNMSLEISTKPLGIEPDCCQPSVRDINTGKLFVNEKMHP